MLQRGATLSQAPKEKGRRRRLGPPPERASPCRALALAVPTRSSVSGAPADLPLHLAFGARPALQCWGSTELCPLRSFVVFVSISDLLADARPCAHTPRRSHGLTQLPLLFPSPDVSCRQLTPPARAPLDLFPKSPVTRSPRIQAVYAPCNLQQ